MWAITTGGFVSLVQDNTDTDFIRVRARRAQHLTDTFPTLLDADVIDLGANAPDYRWHARIPRTHVAEAMYDAVKELGYTSHVKENVAGTDNVMYRAMMSCWNALHQLQTLPAPSLHERLEANLPGWTDDANAPSITVLSNTIADRMTMEMEQTNDGPALDVNDALEIADSYDLDDDEDEVLAAMLVLAEEVRRLRAEADDGPVDATFVEQRRLEGAAINQMTRGR